MMSDQPEVFVNIQFIFNPSCYVKPVTITTNNTAYVGETPLHEFEFLLVARNGYPKMRSLMRSWNIIKLSVKMLTT